MDMFNVAPEETLLIVKFPPSPAAVPISVPATTTLAPINPSPVTASVTVPETVIWPNAKLKVVNKVMKKY